MTRAHHFSPSKGAVDAVGGERRREGSGGEAGDVEQPVAIDLDGTGTGTAGSSDAA